MNKMCFEGNPGSYQNYIYISVLADQGKKGA